MKWALLRFLLIFNLDFLNFSQVSYNAMINEAATKNEKVVAVRAFDDDSDENGRIMYR